MRADHGRGVVRRETDRGHGLRFGRARLQRADGTRDRVDRLISADIAEHLHLDRAGREQRLPQGAERLGRGVTDLVTRRRPPARIAGAEKAVKIAREHAVGRGFEPGIIGEHGGLRAGQRARVPAGRGELRGHQAKLVGEVPWRGHGGELERIVVDVEIEADAAARGHRVDIALLQLADAAGDQRIVGRPGGRFTIGRQRVEAATETHADIDPVGLRRSRIDHQPDAVGELDLFQPEFGNLLASDHLGRRPEPRELREIHRSLSAADSGDALHIGAEHRRELGRCIALRLLRADDRTGGSAFEDLLRRGEDSRGREHALAPCFEEHVLDHRRAGRRLADIDCLDHVVGKLAAGIGARGIDHRLVGDTLFGQFAVDLRLGRRGGLRISDHRAHILQRGFPIIADGRDLDEGDVGRSRRIVKPDPRREIAAAGAGARFQPPVDHGGGDHVDQPVLVEDNRVGVELPWAQHRHHRHGRQAGLDDRAGGRLLRTGHAEIGLCRCRAGAAPRAEIFGDEPFEHRRIEIPRDDDHRPLRPVPAIVEGLHRIGRRRLERLGMADRRAVGEGLASEEQGVHRIRQADLRPRLLALLRQHGGALGIERCLGDIGLADHAREDLQALVERRLGRAGQVKLVDGLGRRGLGIAVGAESGTETLPHALRLPVRHEFRAAKREMLDQMRIAELAVLLHQRAGIDPYPHRDLAWRHPVLAHRVAQSVGQRAEAPGGIGHDVAALVQPGIAARDVGAGCGGRNGLPADRRRQAEQERGNERQAQHARGKIHGSDPSGVIRPRPALVRQS
ncbi:hypothetical protein MGWOODY_Smn756 [hydrothermal vent metagenome]|uniref:Uncharacterized protein n=1 Tax=hydrothermal vent metagenome TaxID=652676 RepID=A0A170PN06_9ZZZZ